MEAMDYLIKLNQMNIKELPIEGRKIYYKIKKELLYNHCSIRGYLRQFIQRYGVYDCDRFFSNVYRLHSTDNYDEALRKCEEFEQLRPCSIGFERLRYYLVCVYLRAVYYLLEFEYKKNEQVFTFHLPLYSIANTYYIKNDELFVRGYKYGNWNFVSEVIKKLDYLGIYKNKSSGFLPLDRKLFREFVDKYNF